jgi:hypothetical protein
MRRYSYAAFTVTLLALMASAPAQELPAGLRQKLDALVTTAYQSASAGLPCRVKAGGKPHMIRWQDVDECLNDASGRVDWQALRTQLEPFRAAVPNLSPNDFDAIVGAAFSARALPFEKVFVFKDKDPYLPLTNSLLKFLPADSLQGVEVIDKTGKGIGTFAGTYSFEKTGGLATANTYRLTLFQYTDTAGNIQSANERLLLGSFGVPWASVKGQPGFRLTTDNLARPGAK